MAAILEEKGIAYSQLGVNRAGHCDTVNTIREDFRRALEDVRFSAAETPLFSTYLAAPAEDGAMESCEYWLDQMSGPVLFYDSVEQLAKEGRHMLCRDRSIEPDEHADKKKAWTETAGSTHFLHLQK